MSFSIKPIHPFPARMAPEIAFEEASSLPKRSIILDPMSGSGTVMRTISEQGHIGIAFDMDPLAVLMTKVWTNPISPKLLRDSGEEVILRALALKDHHGMLPWIDCDKETKSFIDFWFGKPQKSDLRKLSFILQSQKGPIGDALRIAFSRLIITKDRGASLARDVSHSRPHRVRKINDYAVMSEFSRSVSYIASRLETQPPPGNVEVILGDARQLDNIKVSSIDAIITSPPYLNAIDYMRGHKLSLVWFGYQIKDLRSIRHNSIGAERGLNINTNKIINNIYNKMPQLSNLPIREQRIVNRYIIDMNAIMSEFSRVLKPEGKIILVIGNSCIKGTFVENARIVALIAQDYNFILQKSRERDLPSNRRYLPPPSGKERSDFQKRMRTETILSLVH